MLSAISGVGSGALSSDQMQALTAGLGAMNLNANDLASLGNALGLNTQQMTQIQQNLQASRQPAVPGISPPPPPYPSQYSQQPALYTQQPGAPGGVSAPLTPPTSMIEAKYQQLDNPLVTATPPSPNNLTQFGYAAFMSLQPLIGRDLSNWRQ